MVNTRNGSYDPENPTAIREDNKIDERIKRCLNDRDRRHEISYFLRSPTEEDRKKRALEYENDNGWTAILRAIHLGVEVEEVKLILEFTDDITTCKTQPYEENVLHMAAYLNSSIEIFECLVGKGGAEMIKEKDSLGNTPFHYACAWNNELKVIKYLVEEGGKDVLKEKNKKNWVPYSQYPGVQAYLDKEGGYEYEASVESQINVKNSLSFHELIKLCEIGEMELRLEDSKRWKELYDEGDKSVLMELLWFYTRATSPFIKMKFSHLIHRMIDIGGKTLIMKETEGKNNVLHYAAMDAAPLHIVKHLVEVGGIQTLLARNKMENTPLHEACISHAPVEVIDFFVRNVDTDALGMENKNKETPLQVLLNDDFPYNDRIVALQQAWYDSDSKCTKHLHVQDARKVIIWAKQDASHITSNNFVKALLNEYFIKPRYFMVIMFDLYCQAAIVCALSLPMLQETYEEGKCDTTTNISFYFLILSTVWFLTRELMQIISSDMEEYIRGHENILDILQIIFLIWTLSVLNDCQEKADTGILAANAGILATTVGLAWLSLLFVLGQLFYSFSIFTLAFVKIAKALIPFAATAIIFVTAFAHIFFIIDVSESHCKCFSGNNTIEHNNTEYNNTDSNTTECNLPDDFGWSCKANSSFFQSFTMMLGSGASGFLNWDHYDWEDIKNNNWREAVAAVLYAILIVILLLNILIGAISNVFSDVQSHSADAFWTTRLDFMAEVNSIVTFFCQNCNNNCCVVESSKKRYRNDFLFYDTEWYSESCPEGDRLMFFNWWYFPWEEKKPSLLTRLEYYRKHALLKQVFLPDKVFTNIIFGLKYDKQLHGFQAFLSIVMKYLVLMLSSIVWILYLCINILPFVLGSPLSKNFVKYLFCGPIETEPKEDANTHILVNRLHDLKAQISSLQNDLHQMKDHMQAKSLQNDLHQVKDHKQAKHFKLF